MKTVQTNVRVLPGDKPLIRALAARLRIEPRFHERLKSLLEEDSGTALQQRVEQLEEQVEWLVAAGQASTSLRPPHLPAAPAWKRPDAPNGAAG